MKAALCLLLLVPLVAAMDLKLIASMDFMHNGVKETGNPLTSANAVFKFLFVKPVSGFEASDVRFSCMAYGSTGARPTPVKGSLKLHPDSTPEKKLHPFQSWEMTVSGFTTDSNCKVTFDLSGVCACTKSADGTSCTSAAGAKCAAAKKPMEFDVFIGAVPAKLSSSTPEIVTTGGPLIDFKIKFNHKVTAINNSRGQNPQIWAQDSFGENLDIFDQVFGVEQWEYTVSGINGDRIFTGLTAGAGADIGNNPTMASSPAQLVRTLAIRQDCVTKPVWTEWTECNTITRTQTRLNRPIQYQPAMFGGRICDLSVKQESRTCTPVNPAQSCRAIDVFTGMLVTKCAYKPTAFDVCDCTPGCLTKANGLPCCPDIQSVCNVGCTSAGCDVMILDVNADVVCSCDWECKSYGDCCKDFDAHCQGKICGHVLTTGVTKAQLCGSTWEDAAGVSCHCDRTCLEYDDCCPDYYRICDAHSSCKSQNPDNNAYHMCGRQHTDCGCDVLCPYYGDCCMDFGTTCAYKSDLDQIDTFIMDLPLAGLNYAAIFDNPNAPPESCDCVGSGLGTEACCGSNVGYMGRRCGCAADCVEYGDCCDDYQSVCV